MTPRRTVPKFLTIGLLAAAFVATGCATAPRLPAPLEHHTQDARTWVFDVNHDQRPDFWHFGGPDGRKTGIAYAAQGGDAPGQRIDLDALDAADCPHFLIALDGVPFEIVDELYRAGHFRFFYPPARVINCFPGMTDLALSDLFHVRPCRAYQALYYDRAAGRLSSGSGDYLSAANSPWVAHMDYRCSFWWDALVYLNPQAVFNHELKGILRAFRRIDTGWGCAYSVGTAGLGTRQGRPGIEEYLRTIERLCEQIIYERRGRVKLTLVADHGHNLVENRRVSFRPLLAECGYRPARQLRRPQDVVTISYGLVTCADFHTDDPAGVAECLLRHADVELTCYPADGAVVVRDRAGLARILPGQQGYRYEPVSGDPLQLVEIIATLRAAGHVNATGEIDPDALFTATLEHYYPDPLDRIWNAFNGLVEHPADVIVSLRDGACHGSRFFYTMVGTMSSTHGGLNRVNSTTFVMTMLGNLPPALRTREVLPALESLGAPQRSGPAQQQLAR